MWRCNNCHSTAVQGIGWLDLNSREYVDDIEDLDEYWCESCEALTEVYFKHEPEENDTALDEEDEEDDGIPEPLPISGLLDS